MTVQHKPGIEVQIRWLIRRDMADVLRIEQESFEFPWTEEDFLGCLRQRNCIGMVAEHDQQIVGFMVYELHKSRLSILNFAVASEARRQQVGAQMAQKLIDKLSQQRRNEVMLEVRETNLDAQLFFSQNGFRAVSILRNHYDDTTEDAYVMRYRLHEEDEVLVPSQYRNRISEYDDGFGEEDERRAA
jgi:ribosomal-protein-alanine N-acetyltransferase